MHVPEVVIPSESYSSPMDDTMSSARYDSSSKDIDATSFAPMSPWSVIPEPWVSPWVDLVNLVFEDEGEDVEEDTSIKEDLFMDEEDPVTKLELMEEDSSDESY